MSWYGWVFYPPIEVFMRCLLYFDYFVRVTSFCTFYLYLDRRKIFRNESIWIKPLLRLAKHFSSTEDIVLLPWRQCSKIKVASPNGSTSVKRRGWNKEEWVKKESLINERLVRHQPVRTRERRVPEMYKGPLIRWWCKSVYVHNLII